MRAVGCRSFVHSCGNETRMLGHLIRCGADCLELDPLTDPATCKRETQGKVSVLGMPIPTASFAVELLTKSATTHSTSCGSWLPMEAS